MVATAHLVEHALLEALFEVLAPRMLLFGAVAQFESDAAAVTARLQVVVERTATTCSSLLVWLLRVRISNLCLACCPLLANHYTLGLSIASYLVHL